MNSRQVVDTYDEGYATGYNERFLLNKCQSRSDHEIEIVKQLLVPGGRWLDVACGTGYVLSRFPGLPRAGLDLSPAMLKLAGQANPDALFLREGNFLDDVPEWHHQWALVTCMWYAYCLVESIAGVECVIRNLAQWTSDNGACFVPLCDPALLASGVHIPYTSAEPFFGGTVMITGVIWSWNEESGKKHQNLIAPQIEHMVAMFKEHFDLVELVEYPLHEPGRSPMRKAIIARQPTRE